MIKTTLNIEGMMCAKCEKHMDEAIRNTFRVEKVSSSHSKNQTEILSDEPLEEELLKQTVDTAGYTLKGIQTETVEKKGFSLFGR